MDSIIAGCQSGKNSAYLVGSCIQSIHIWCCSSASRYSDGSGIQSVTQNIGLSGKCCTYCTCRSGYNHVLTVGATCCILYMDCICTSCKSGEFAVCLV